jgi:anthranilate phosphoribosyltransferase
MSHAFRTLLRKVGSGNHTSESLTRSEAAAATRMMLQQEATPAQIGAFMIAHRIRRPTGEELAGMLDAYNELGGRLQANPTTPTPVVLGVPYDGRDRTAPLTSLTALLLTTAGYPVILHGGQRMPTKYGVPLIEIWQALGIDWATPTLEQTQAIFDRTGVGFVYLPTHFPLAEGLVPYRDQIGKRPPFATLELMWSPCQGNALIISGFVHPPTEQMIQVALSLHGVDRFITIKGLEGSGDLPRQRTCIMAIHQPQQQPSIERLLLHPRDYGFAGEDVPFNSLGQLVEQMQDVLHGNPSPLLESAVWNGGFYLFSCGACEDLLTGLAMARELFTSGKVAKQLELLQQVMMASRSAIALSNSPALEVVPSER